MKATTSTIFMSLLLLPLLSIAQLQVDVEDQHICRSLSNQDTTKFLVQASVSGGFPPYTYTWYSDSIQPFSGSNITVHASSILSDTTILNPEITYVPKPRGTVVYLLVMDSLGNTALDSSLLTQSDFGITLGGNFSAGIEKGDSIWYTRGGNISPITFPVASWSWFPTHGLSDSTLPSQFWMKPDSSINYSYIITDSMGCSQTEMNMATIYVYPVGVETIIPSKTIIQVFPNPTQGEITIQTENAIEAVKITSINGQLLLQNKSGSKTINVSELTAGSYVLQALQNELWQTTTFMKE